MAQKNDSLHEGLERGLQERHIQLIAIGGAIGVGLFLGSSKGIKLAGPALMLAYLYGGLVIFCIMRALGEIAVAHPVSGSFSAYANLFMGPRMGYTIGWTYWLVWTIICMVECTAVAIYTHYWLPDLPQWIPAFLALLSMVIVNLVTVKAYGEIEFWFALIKVVTIILMIIMGLGMIIFGFGNKSIPTGISNLWANGGFMPFGISGVAKSMTIVMFAYLGVELIGVAAGEAKNPEKTIPAAINKVFWRILIFYIGLLTVIMSIFPWDQIGTQGSPFVLVFDKLGIASAAGIINFVVLTAALSSCNSGVYSTGRMLYNLALQKRAPAYFAGLSTQKVPMRGVLFTGGVMLAGVFLNYAVPNHVFDYLTSLSTAAALFVWGSILVLHMRSRKVKSPKEIQELSYPMPFYPLSSWFGLVSLSLIGISLCLEASSRLGIILVLVWFVVLNVLYNIMGWNKEKVS